MYFTQIGRIIIIMMNLFLLFFLEGEGGGESV